jgi:hypothetical protein
MATRTNGLVVKMELARETKNTYRYEATDEDASVTTLYVMKEAADAAGLGSNITLTVK